MTSQRRPAPRPGMRPFQIIGPNRLIGAVAPLAARIAARTAASDRWTRAAMSSPMSIANEASQQPSVPLVRTRPTEPSDYDFLLAMWARCSPASRYYRFHSPVHTMPAACLSNVVGQLPESLVALDGQSGDIVGLASLFATGPCTAELGILIQDDHQRLGIGTELIRELLQRAPLRGITTIHGTVLSDRPSYLTFVRKILPDAQAHNDGIITHIRADLGRYPGPAVAPARSRRNSVIETARFPRFTGPPAQLKHLAVGRRAEIPRGRDGQLL